MYFNESSKEKGFFGSCGTGLKMSERSIRTLCDGPETTDIIFMGNPKRCFRISKVNYELAAIIPQLGKKVLKLEKQTGNTLHQLQISRLQ